MGLLPLASASAGIQLRHCLLMRPEFSSVSKCSPCAGPGEICHMIVLGGEICHMILPRGGTFFNYSLQKGGENLHIKE